MIRYCLPFILSACFLFFSCKKDSPPGPGPDASDNARANNWIYNVLSEEYYWSPYLTDKSKTNLELAPQDYLKSVRYADDRFSVVEPLETETRASADGYVTDFGINFIIWRYESGLRLLQITSIVPGSPAERAGLRRSDRIDRIDGQTINESNWQALLARQRISLSLCDETFEPIREVELAKAPYYDTPVILDTVYTVGTKRVGYLVYYKYSSAFEDSNDVDLMSAFRRFKQAGVNELILDLRFNGGGLEPLFIKMASLIAPAELVSGNAILAYTTDRVDRTKEPGIDRFSLTPEELATANLDLDRLIVLANRFTASASEVTMHCLRQYMDLVHYGETTTGKYVGSQTFSGESKNIPWELHPITTRLYDKRFLGDPGYPDGLSPDVPMIDDGPFRGQLGEYQPDQDYDRMLLRVMNDLRGASRSAADPEQETPAAPTARMISPVRPTLILTK